MTNFKDEHYIKVYDELGSSHFCKGSDEQLREWGHSEESIRDIKISCVKGEIDWYKTGVKTYNMLIDASQEPVEQETNKFKRWFIYYWYNDWVRALVILNPLTYALILLGLLYLGMPEEYGTTVFSILIFVGWVSAAGFNDYNTLNRIGLDCYRKPLKNTKKNGDL